MLYGLIGEKLSHSFSKEIHESIAGYEYRLMEIEPQKLGSFLEKREFKAINVTIPYKEKVIPFLDEISPEAEKTGAVNTIVNKNGKLFGYNTDLMGLAALAEYSGIDLKNRKVLILGSGGTSKTALAACEKLGAREFVRVSRGKKDGCKTYEQTYNECLDFDIIINTTPSGMYPDLFSKPVDVKRFSSLSGVLDVIYNPLRTSLVLEAEKAGIPAASGLYMLVAQAVFACALFTGGKAQTGQIEKTYRELLNKKRNIVLTGMPSSGKTVIGNLLAQKLGRRFVDTDDMIIERINMPIGDYFAAYGEKSFREEESRVIRQLTAENSLVIATGGGAVLNEENVLSLKKNGLVVFLDRSPQLLTATSDRPLSSNADDMMKRYNERYSIYLGTADMRVESNEPPPDVAKEILRRL